MAGWELVQSILGPAAPAALAGAVLLRFERARWSRSWRGVARSPKGLVVSHDPLGSPFSARLSGEVDGRRCKVSVASDRSGHVVARAEVPLEHPQLRLEVARKSSVTWLEQRLGATEVVLGDPWFDKRYLVRATDVTRCRQVLDRPTRRALIAADLDRVAVEQGALVGDLRGSAIGAARGLVSRVDRALPALVGLAERIEQRPARVKLVAPVATQYPPRARVAGWGIRVVVILGLAVLLLVLWLQLARAILAATAG